MYIGCSSSYANCVGLKAMNSKYSMQIPSGIPPAMHSEAFIAEIESSLNKSYFFGTDVRFWNCTSNFIQKYVKYVKTYS